MSPLSLVLPLLISFIYFECCLANGNNTCEETYSPVTKKSLNPSYTLASGVPVYDIRKSEKSLLKVCNLFGKLSPPSEANNTVFLFIFCPSFPDKTTP